MKIMLLIYAAAICSIGAQEQSALTEVALGLKPGSCSKDLVSKFDKKIQSLGQ